jgi:nucleotide-binding universal stress UspA family protein
VKAFERILVPVDFNTTARPAIDYAAMMALRFNATVEIVHVWQPPALIPANFLLVTSDPGTVPQSLEDIARNHAVERTQELADLIKSRGVTAKVHIGIGNPAHEILGLAESGHFDLIIMGSHGRTGVARALIGSVAEKVVRHAPCPVLVVRASAPPIL